MKRKRRKANLRTHGNDKYGIKNPSNHSESSFSNEKSQFLKCFANFGNLERIIVQHVSICITLCSFVVLKYQPLLDFDTVNMQCKIENVSLSFKNNKKMHTMRGNMGQYSISECFTDKIHNIRFAIVCPWESKNWNSSADWGKVPPNVGKTFGTIIS